MHKMFDINRTKIKGGCQSERRVVIHNSKSHLPLPIQKLVHIAYYVCRLDTMKLNMQNKPVLTNIGRSWWDSSKVNIPTLAAVSPNLEIGPCKSAGPKPL